MKLLINKDCKRCENVKNIDKDFPQIKKYYVEDGKVEIDGKIHDISSSLPGLPALITEKFVYVGDEKILEFIETLKSGEK